jgi:hypothetical protein
MNQILQGETLTGAWSEQARPQVVPRERAMPYKN